MHKFFKILFLCLAVIVILLVIVFVYFFTGVPQESGGIIWGVDFSQMRAESLGLNWKETYLAILNNLKVKNIKLHTQWDWVEGQKNDYFFDDIDWQLKEAQDKGVKIIYVVGVKTGRWPECHIPTWVSGLDKNERENEVLQYISQVVERYKNNSSIINWQVENEPLFKFGECPSWYYDGGNLLKKEVELVKKLDPSKKIIISDSGELSFWFNVAKIGDIVGTTLYRRTWVDLENLNLSTFLPKGFYSTYPITPAFYYKKSQLIKDIFSKDVICTELQAEPWVSEDIAKVPLSDQQKTMNPEIFQANIEYAKQTHLDTFYLWGVEWWYWMKEKQGKPEMWQEAQKLFKQ